MITHFQWANLILAIACSQTKQMLINSEYRMFEGEHIASIAEKGRRVFSVRHESMFMMLDEGFGLSNNTRLASCL